MEQIQILIKIWILAQTWILGKILNRAWELEGLENPPDHRLAAGAADDIEAGLEGNWRRSERGPFAARAVEGGAEEAGDGDAEER